MSVNKLRTGHASTDRALDVVYESIGRLEAVADRSELVTDLTFTVGATVLVPHRLGRMASGYYVVRCVGATAAGILVDAGGVDRRQALNLRGVGYGTTVTLDIVVF